MSTPTESKLIRRICCWNHTLFLAIIFIIDIKIRFVFAVGGYKLGKAIIEGKTKVVYDLPNNAGLCLLQNKDKITAGDGVKKHDMVGKAAISNATNGKVFSILNAAGMKTAYVTQASPTAFISRKCEMIPIEWVTRRLATGSYCRRYPTVKEGYRYVKLLVYTTNQSLSFWSTAFFAQSKTNLLKFKCLSLISWKIPFFISVFRHQNKRHSSKMMLIMTPNGPKRKSSQPTLNSTVVKSVRSNNLQ